MKQTHTREAFLSWVACAETVGERMMTAARMSAPSRGECAMSLPAMLQVRWRFETTGRRRRFGLSPFFRALPSSSSWTIQDDYIRFHLKESECGEEEKDQDLIWTLFAPSRLNTVRDRHASEDCTGRTLMDYFSDRSDVKPAGSNLLIEIFIFFFQHQSDPIAFDGTSRNCRRGRVLVGVTS